MICVVALIVQRNWAFFTNVVHPHQIKPSDLGDDSYDCVFYWRGRECSGFFFFKGEPTEDLFLRVIGIDCESGLWYLEECNEKEA